MAGALKPINDGGFQLYPYNAYKRWIITDTNYSDDYYRISVLKAVAPLYKELIPISASINNEFVYDTTELNNSNSNSTSFLNNKHQKTIWSGLNQMFYKHRKELARSLYTSASVFSIPHTRLGDGIKAESIIISDNSKYDYSHQINIKDTKIDEYHGYLYDSDLDTSVYVPNGNLIGYWGFNNEVVTRNAIIDESVKDESGYANNGYGKNLLYNGGIRTTDSLELPSGTKVTFNGIDSYIKVNNNKQLDFYKDDDYSISLWTLLPTSQSDDVYNYNWILNKNSTYVDYTQDNKLKNVVRNRNIENPIFPFDLKIYNQNTANNGKVVISLSDGLQNVEVSSSTFINDVSEHHIVFNKNGSLLELWVDGVKENSASINLKSQIANSNDMVIGSKYLSDGYSADVVSGYGCLSGSVDEIRIYNKALSENEIKGLSDNDYLTGSAYQTNIIGEVFYKHGVMVVSDVRPLYDKVWIGQNAWDYGSNYGWNTEYKSTKQLNEVSVLCEIGANEFNVSQNPSLRKDGKINSEFLKPFVTGSSFNTYYTTIGLYNPKGELLAVGKLASAIKNRDDVDITVKVRFDLDGAFGTPLITNLDEDGKPTTIYKTKSGKYIWNKSGIPAIGVK